MYELQDINSELVTNFYKAIGKVLEQENGYDLLSKIIKKAIHVIEPEMPPSISKHKFNFNNTNMLNNKLIIVPILSSEVIIL